MNSHLKDAEGKDFSLFASFFRVYKGKDSNGNATHAHAMSAAISDIENKKYYPIAFVDVDAHKVLKYQMDNNMYKLDKRLETAFREIVNKGKVPLPDVPFAKECEVALDRLSLNFNEGNSFHKLDNGDYHVRVAAADNAVSFDLTFHPLKKVMRQGHEGVVQVGIKQETMFYYFIPRHSVTGSLTIPADKTEVVSMPGHNVPKTKKTLQVSGDGWYDHEFGGGIRESVYSDDHEEERKVEEKPSVKESEKDRSYAWNWFSVQLSNGMDITATNLMDIHTNAVLDNFIITIDKDSNRTEFNDFKVSSANDWISVKTTCIYPLQWTLTSEEAEINLTLDAAFENQEIITLIAKPAFWEGKLNVSGTIRGEKVTGNAFTERHGFDGSDSLDNFFKRMSTVVRQEINKVLPYDTTYEEARALLADEANDHYMHGASVKVFEDIIIKPLRDVIDRGGKAWRSYACLLSIDCVGGDSWDYKHWLSMPEMMHVGSLIIDDIQDKSETRRGEPCCHIKFGDSIAINAGTAAYFLAMDTLQSRTPNLTPATRLKLYELYFLTLRAGHCGQGFDIYGLDYLMEDSIENGAGQKLLDAITCTHRLKSAVPAGNLARMGGIIANGTNDQIEAIGRYYESIGIAFQIIDDVLNLRGFEKDVKVRGEDLHEGKITYPVARGMTLIQDRDVRRKFYDTLKTKPDYPVVAELINTLNSVGAIDKSVEDAEVMVDNAWKDVDKYIPDSFYKIMLRSFGMYVLQRHY